MIELLTGQFGAWLMSAVGVLIVLGTTWLHGKSSGKKGERDRQQRERAKVDKKIDQVEDAVADRTTEENRERLKEWSPESS